MKDASRHEGLLRTLDMTWTQSVTAARQLSNAIVQTFESVERSTLRDGLSARAVLRGRVQMGETARQYRRWGVKAKSQRAKF